jgi:hypothetical protein
MSLLYGDDYEPKDSEDDILMHRKSERIIIDENGNKRDLLAEERINRIRESSAIVLTECEPAQTPIDETLFTESDFAHTAADPFVTAPTVAPIFAVTSAAAPGVVKIEIATADLLAIIEALGKSFKGLSLVESLYDQVIEGVKAQMG